MSAMLAGCQPRAAVSQAMAASLLHGTCHASTAEQLLSLGDLVRLTEGQAAGAPCDDVLDIGDVKKSSISRAVALPLPYHHQHHIITSTPAWLRYMKMNMRPFFVGTLTF